MENTIENKAKFFAQYWGKTFINGIGGHSALAFIDLMYIANGTLEATLLLKPLSAISDEDAKTLVFDLGPVAGLDAIIREPSSKLVKEVVDNYSKVGSLFMLPSRFTDKARELGYATDWNGLSVEEQVSRGWVKLSK